MVLSRMRRLTGRLTVRDGTKTAVRAAHLQGVCIPRASAMQRHGRGMFGENQMVSVRGADLFMAVAENETLRQPA